MDKAIVFVGTAACGKSTLIKMVNEKLGWKIFDEVDEIAKFFKFGWQGSEEVILKDEQIREAFFNLIKNASTHEGNVIVEMSPDLPTETMPALIAALKGMQKDVLVVYCEETLDNCLQRNRNRKETEGRFVPEQLLHVYHRFGKDFFEEVSKNLEVKFTWVNMSALNNYVVNQILLRVT